MTRKVSMQSLAVTGLAALVALSAASCVSTFFTPAAASGSLAFQIENATGSMAEVLIEVLDANGQPAETSAATDVAIPVVTVSTDDVQYSTLQPIGAAAAAQASSTSGGSIRDATNASVKVDGYHISAGRLACGSIIRITASMESTGASVVLSGSGSGTPGFDTGSVGAEGERYLIAGVDFECGEAVVIRLDDDGSGVGVSQGNTARGRLAVVGQGDVSPFDPISTPDDIGTNGVIGTSSLRVRVENQTSTLATVMVTAGPANADASAATNTSYEVNVAANVVTEGSFLCGEKVTISSLFPNPTSDSASGDGSDAMIVLTGDGTGSPGFDEASIGANGERILFAGTHFDCGDTVAVAILDDSSVMTPQGFDAQGAGAGTVQVVPEGAAVDDEPVVPMPEPEPDVSVVVDNQTDAFVRLNVVSGASSLSSQATVYVPPAERTAGAIACSDQYTLSAYSLLPAALDGLQDQVLIVLTGDGSGTAGFDGGSIGQIGQRLLTAGEQFECGDTVTVTVTDPGQPGFEEPDLRDDQGDVIGFSDINSNGVQDAVADRLGSAAVDVN